MSKKALKLAFVVALCVGAWSAPVPSEAQLYMLCDSRCCSGTATGDAACKDMAGVVMTCDDWWAGHSCP